MPGSLLPRPPFSKDTSSSSISPHSRRSLSSPHSHSTAPARPDAPKRDSGTQRIHSTMDSLKRHSLAGITSKHGKDKAEKGHKEKQDKSSQQSSVAVARPSTKLDVVVESPPNMLYGTKQNSTGALYSGQLLITVTEPEVTLASLSVNLIATIATKKPVVHGCSNCITTVTNLHNWAFIKEPKTLQAGQHSFPFSYLLPGHLPATTHGGLGVLDYFLDATANLQTPTSSSQSVAHEQAVKLRHPVTISRAIAPVPEKSSLRIFPPTNITATLTFVPVTYPIGNLPVVMRVSGLTEKKTKAHMYERWAVRKVHWKLEERERMISPACSKHAHKVGGDGKGIKHEETRTIGTDEIKEGWKNNYDEGTIELEFKCQPNGIVRPLCDVESPTGLTVAHALIVELVIVEEWAPVKKPGPNGTPTGSARVLRMQFPLIMTERAGLGIAWDEEQPPTYEDVPASPPLYPANAGPDDSSWVQGGLGVPDDARSEVLTYTGPPLDEPSPSYAALNMEAASSISSLTRPHTNNLRGWEDMNRPNPGRGSVSTSRSNIEDRASAGRSLDARDAHMDRRSEDLSRDNEGIVQDADAHRNDNTATSEANRAV